MKKEQYMISEIYNNIFIAQQINEELDSEFNNLINEGFGEDIRNMAISAGKSAIQGVSDGVSNLANIPEDLQNYFNAKMPEYLDQLGTYLSTILATGVGSALAVNILGKVLMSLAKKMGKTAEDNTAVLMSMLPAEVAQRMQAYEDLRQRNPSKYRDLSIDINFEALEALKKAMKAKNKNIEQGGMLPKILNHLGKVMNSTPGSMVGGLIIAYLCQKLGINPLPIFPKIG